MDTLNSLVAAIVTSLLISTIVLFVIINPMRRVIGVLCPSAEVTPFWTSFTILMFYAVPLLFALWWTPNHPDAVSIVRGALAAVLFGVIGGLSVIGLKVANAKAR